MSQKRIDYEAVGNAAQNFGEIGGRLGGVSTKLEMLMRLLETDFFRGSVGSRASQNFIQEIQPHLQRVTKICNEMQHDLEAAAGIIDRGDEDAGDSFTGS